MPSEQSATVIKSSVQLFLELQAQTATASGSQQVGPQLSNVGGLVIGHTDKPFSNIPVKHRRKLVAMGRSMASEVAAPQTSLSKAPSRQGLSNNQDEPTVRNTGAVPVPDDSATTATTATTSSETRRSARLRDRAKSLAPDKAATSLTNEGAATVVQQGPKIAKAVTKPKTAKPRKRSRPHKVSEKDMTKRVIDPKPDENEGAETQQKKSRATKVIKDAKSLTTTTAVDNGHIDAPPIRERRSGKEVATSAKD